MTKTWNAAPAARTIATVTAGVMACSWPVHAAQAQEVAAELAELAVHGPELAVADYRGAEPAGEGERFTLAATSAEQAPVHGPQLSVAAQATMRQAAAKEAFELEQALVRRRTARREVVYQVLNVVDAVQTISCLDRGVCHELNPLLGRDPSTQRVIGFKLASGGVHYLVTSLFEEIAPEAVGPWQLTTIGIQGGAVAWNMQFVF
ncbi:hypothetical protein [Qipengyuania sphaerica]|uniref:hypothetical protein n=1 Tax=Qipengyuania sphaerica TaxID=2867243 RepID=UPI001C886ACF|nr:hypothetical protein [Qipengyuania sphaerica]MBX7540863.1 hypothetical protein [Qipengyuania sphaerica]